MSAPSGSGITAATSIHTPLSQVCRWDDADETVLVLDSIESDGRFVLGTLVAGLPPPHQANNRVLWLCCSAVTDQLTLSSLKKIGCPKAMTGSASLPESPASAQPKTGTATSLGDERPRLTIRSIPTLLSRAVSKVDDEESSWKPFDRESFVKNLYRQVKEWVRLGSEEEEEQAKKQTEDDTAGERRWVVLDDLSTLAALVGERLVYGLILSLQALSRAGELPFALALRCSNDVDVEAEGLVDPRSTQWFGAGDSSTTGNEGCPWERQLVELSDTIIDVTPLASGSTREAHGRLIFSSRGTAAGATSRVYNYCLTENQALAIRIERS